MDDFQKLQILDNNQKGMLYEMMHRLIANAAYHAFVYKGRFECPFCNSGCPNKVDACSNFVDFGTIHNNCKYGDLPYDETNGFRYERGGKNPDCMFYDYLINYNYNISKIKDQE